MAFCTDAGSATSQKSARPSRASSAAVCSALSTLMSAMVTCAPSQAYAKAHSRPMPSAPPVIRMTLPASSPSAICASIRMEDLLHPGPPLAFATGLERLLHRVGDGPPFTSFRVRRHFRHVGLIIGAVVLVIGEKVTILQVNRVIANVAFSNCLDYFRPYMSVI